MLEAMPNPVIPGAIISGNVSTGYRAAADDGRPLRLALVDEAGQVVAAGDAVAWGAWRVCVQVQEQFWQGHGHLIVHSSPPGRPELFEALTKKAA